MQPALQSLCILLSGKDPAADAQAIAAAKNWKDDAGRPLPTPPAVFARIQTARPVLVLIAGTIPAATDGGLQFVAETFAEGFFRSVGV
jgi:hypothetical protein